MRWYVLRLRRGKRTIFSNFISLSRKEIGLRETKFELVGAFHCYPRYNGGVSFAIRDFQPVDFETLWLIDQTCFPAGISYSRAELKIYMRRHTAFTLVAHTTIEDGKALSGADKKTAWSGKSDIVSFIVAEAGPRGRGHIITIDVVAAVRRFGVGSLLLRGAEDRLLSAKSSTVELETAVDNVSALSFYKRHGYSVIKNFPRYYSNGVDALVLEKRLV